MTPAERAGFVRANTEILCPPLVPEVRLHLAHEALPIWQKTEDELGEIGLPPPFWAFAWAGGQALARHVLDEAELVKGKRVVDLASGSGLVGIAARKAGAASVLAADIDAFSVAAIAINAALNAVAIDVTAEDLLASPPPPADVILVGICFMNKALRRDASPGLRRHRNRVLKCGSAIRTKLPAQGQAARHCPLFRAGDPRSGRCRDQEDGGMAAGVTALPLLLR